MNHRVSPALVGLFVVIGIVLGVLAVLLFGSGRYFDERRSFVSFFPGSVNGLTVGADVSFRGVPVGTVREILLTVDTLMTTAGEDMRIPVIFEIDETLLRRRGATLQLDDEEDLAFLLERGLSAGLATGSLVTGRLYVALDFRPDDAPVMTGLEYEYPEIPTVRTSMAELSEKAEELASRLVEVDIESVLTALRSTLDGANTLVNDPELQGLAANVEEIMSGMEMALRDVRSLVNSADSALIPMSERVVVTAERAEESLGEIDETMVALRGVMDPDAPMLVGLGRAFGELELAARALRRVAEVIERDPGVLLRGRASGGGDR